MYEEREREYKIDLTPGPGFSVSRLLERAEKRSSLLATRAFDEEVARALNDAIFGKSTSKAKPDHGGESKERRGKGDTSGTKKPRNSGRRRGATNVQTGKRLRARGVSGLKIDWNDFGDACVGDVQLPTVLLNEGNPMLARMRAQQNYDGIVSNVMWLLAEFDRKEEHTGQRKLNFAHSETNDMSMIVGAALSEDITFDGHRLAEDATG